MTTPTTNFKQQILIGLALQLIPLMLVGALGLPDPETQTGGPMAIVSVLLPFVILGACIAGCVPLIRGCRGYVNAKGYRPMWGWLGLFNWLGLSLLIMLPDRGHQVPSDSLNQEPPENAFARISLARLLLKYCALGTLYALLLIVMATALMGQSLEEIQDNAYISNVLGIVISSHFLWLLFRLIQECNLDLSALFGTKRQLSPRYLTLTIISTVALFTFSLSLDRILLYGLSHRFPGYVEQYFESAQSFTNVPELILMAVAAIILAPLLEELLFRGIILQKWGLKWGVLGGVVASSLLFAIVHVRFDVISLFIGGIFLSLLYLRTSTLTAPILCHGLFNAGVVGWNAVRIFSKPATERGTAMAVSEFQTLVSPVLDRYIVLAIVSTFLLLYLFFQLRSHSATPLPYLKNQDL